MEREFRMEEGKAGDEVILDSPDLKFGDKAIRRGFIRKVYMILSVQVSKRCCGIEKGALVLIPSGNFFQFFSSSIIKIFAHSNDIRPQELLQIATKCYNVRNAILR